MEQLVDIATIAPLEVWGDSVIARRINGERLTLAVVELAPNATVPEHRHAAEQLGMVIQGTVRFRIADERKELSAGGTWRIVSDVPHECVAGPDGAVVIDVFTPVRSDWESLAEVPARTPKWPR